MLSIGNCHKIILSHLNLEFPIFFHKNYLMRSMTPGCPKIKEKIKEKLGSRAICVFTKSKPSSTQKNQKK